MIESLHAVALSAALLLLASGAAKLRAPQPAGAMLRGLGLSPLRPLARPLPVRAFAVVEIAVGAGFALRGGRGAATALGAVYAAFVAVVLVSMLRGARASCGCFGASDAPIGRAHLGVDAVALTAAVVSVARPAGSWAGLTAMPSATAVIAGAQVLVLAALGYLCITALPALAAARRAVLPRP